MKQIFNAIITYTISDDDIREEFSELLEDIGFEEQDDQSTYALPDTEPYDDDIDEVLKDFCEENLEKDDHVDYYWLAGDQKGNAGIELTKFRYKPKRK